MSDIGPSSPVKPAGTGDPPQVAATSGTSEQTEPQKPAGKGAPASTEKPVPERAAPSPAVTLAATLARIPSGSELTGIIVGTDTEGLPVVRTPSATFILSKPLPIAVNSQITLQIQSVGNELRAALLTVNGQVQHPPPTVELSLASVSSQTGPQRPLVAGLSPGPAQTGVPPAILAPGSQVSALVVPAVSDAHIALAAPGTIQAVRLAPGTPLTLQVTSVTLPQGAAIVAQALTTALGLEGTSTTSVPPPSNPAPVTPTLAQIVSQQPVPAVPGTGLERQADAAPGQPTLRVRPETLCRITEFSEHESNGRELDEGERVAVEVLPVLGRPAAAVEPGDGAFDHPTPGLDDEALHPIGSLDDLGLEIGQDAGQGAVKDRPLIGAVGEQFPEKGKQTEQGRQQRETAVAILNVGGGDDAVQQQALRIDQNMPLLALDQLAGIEAVAVDASPPFSALFTL